MKRALRTVFDFGKGTPKSIKCSADATGRGAAGAPERWVSPCKGLGFCRATPDEEKNAYDYMARRASGSVKIMYDSTHRKLKPRHIQLIGIGETIGTALYVQIGHGLLNGGPASLFMASTIWCVPPHVLIQSRH